MSIGKVIRKYRKEKNMTQEEVAVRLGVTAPAVNKWENENSLPDIMLLAPIARLLGISLDTLLSFRDELTAEEINGIINELNEKLKTGSYEEACKEYEELLFEEYSRISMALQGMYGLAMRDKDMERAHRIVDKRQEMARCFEAGRYHEVSGGLELALLEKDADAVILTMQEMLDSLSQIGGFRDSFLYKHMNFREMRPEYIEELRENLLQCFRDEETCGFLKNDERWMNLIVNLSE